MAATPTQHRRADRAWSALLRVHAHLVPQIDTDLQRAAGLPLAWYDVLLELDGAGPLRMTDLGNRVVLSRTRVSRLVTEMQDAGLVARRPNPEDARSAFVDCTDTGRQHLRRAAPHYRDSIATHLAARLDATELDALATILTKLLGPTDLPMPQP
ncbi:MarR family winged helix-turn-helix transcriptional regulator [Nocardia sp. NPDC050712]|uniref:MarR family winged helix-turn-helix transcriptional regulator n=1 Tax=Nocardia sp. NPDC050712 TaxID=3155518 RepID=UPI0033C1321C